MTRSLCALTVIGLLMAACEPQPMDTWSVGNTSSRGGLPPGPGLPGGFVERSKQGTSQSTVSTGTTLRIGDIPLASLRGRSVTMEHLRRTLIDLGGGAALAEVVIDVGLRRRLQQRDASVTDDQLRRERAIFTSAAASDPNNAERLLDRVRRVQNLGNHRYRQLLWRNAAMRMLVSDQIQVSNQAVRNAYAYEYGQKYRVRLIVVESMGEAARIVSLARGGGSFVDLAIRHSTDASRAQGGLLDLISPHDTTWPAAIRDQVVAMQVSDISDPVILDQGFGVLKLVKHQPAQDVQYEDVEAQMRQRTRLGIERMYMQQLAREIVLEADRDLTIMDRALKSSWEQQKKAMWGD